MALRWKGILAVVALTALLLSACGAATGTDNTGTENTGTENTGTENTGTGDEGRLVVYSGRNENLIGPIIERFREETGVEVEVRYGDTAELAATLLEEGDRSPADVFIAQDAGALGAVAREGLFRELPEGILSRVEPRFRSPEGMWVGLSGRARVVVYNTQHLSEADLPASIFDFTDPRWKGRIGWAPTNGSFQAFVTAMRAVHGEDATRRWLEGILANEPRSYPSNAPIVEAVAAGEIDVGFVNHYYLLQLKAERGDDFPAANYYPADGDIGALVNVAGAGILRSAAHPQAAERFLEYLLSEDAQRYFAESTFEYPLVQGVPAPEDVPPLESVKTPDVDLSDLWDLEGTLELLRDVGAL